MVNCIHSLFLNIKCKCWTLQEIPFFILRSSKYCTFLYFVNYFRKLIDQIKFTSLNYDFSYLFQVQLSGYYCLAACLLGCFVLRRVNPFRVIQRRSKFKTIQFSISIGFVYKLLNIITVLFQTVQFSKSIQFQCRKLSYFKQFSLAKVQTVPFKTVQFSISTQF